MAGAVTLTVHEVEQAGLVGGALLTVRTVGVAEYLRLQPVTHFLAPFLIVRAGRGVLQMLCVLLNVYPHDFVKTRPAEPTHSGEETRQVFLGLATAAAYGPNIHLGRPLDP